MCTGFLSSQTRQLNFCFRYLPVEPAASEPRTTFIKIWVGQSNRPFPSPASRVTPHTYSSQIPAALNDLPRSGDEWRRAQRRENGRLIPQAFPTGQRKGNRLLQIAVLVLNPAVRKKRKKERKKWRFSCFCCYCFYGQKSSVSSDKMAAIDLLKAVTFCCCSCVVVGTDVFFIPTSQQSERGRWGLSCPGDAIGYDAFSGVCRRDVIIWSSSA